MKFLKVLPLVFLFLLMNSCYEKLEFNQLENYVAKPVLTASLTNFTLLPRQFYNSAGVQQSSIEDITNFEVFEDSFVKDNIVKIDFYAEIKNDFDRAVTIRVDFLDENNDEVYNFTPIQVGSKNLNFTYLEEIDLAVNPEVKNTFKVRINAELENTGIPINANSIEEFVFKSSVTVYIETDF